MSWNRRQKASKIRQNRERHIPTMSLMCLGYGLVVIERVLLVSEGMKRKKLLNGLKGGQVHGQDLWAHAKR